jgi:hypothetical protein
MKQYNIYTGLLQFGEPSYQYTTLCNSLNEAYEEAYEVARKEFDFHPELFNDEPENVFNDWFVTEMKNQEILDSCISYKVIPTEEDNIDKDNLIIGYIIENGSSSEISS